MPTNIIWKLCNTFCELLAKSKGVMDMHKFYFNRIKIKATEVNTR